MPLCYSFSKSALEPGALNEGEIKEAAAGLMARLDHPSTPTRMHLCATLRGEYNYLLKFEYSALADVAKAILDNRRRFGSGLSQTLTMLEYPDGGPPLRVQGRSACFEKPATPRGILLLQEKLIGGYGISADVKRQLQPILGNGTRCIDVFGPFDYIVEFPACGWWEVVRKVHRARAVLEPRTLRQVPLFCEPFVHWTITTPSGRSRIRVNKPRAGKAYR